MSVVQPGPPRGGPRAGGPQRGDGRAGEPRARAGPALRAVGLLVVAANLRPAIAAVGPVLPAVRHTTGISETVAGLLTSLPVLCFGVFAFIVPRATRRLGLDRALLAAIVVLCAGILLRLAPDTAALFIGTTIAGAGIAVGNVVLPGLVKRDFPTRIAAMTALYSTVLGGGAALGAGLTVPLQRVTGAGWRPALAAWVLPAVVAVGVAAAAAARRRRGGAAGAEQRLRPLLHDPLCWAVTAFMGLQSLTFYATLAWLPTVFQAHGMSATEAGWLLSYGNFASIPASLAAPLAGRRLGRAGFRPLVAGMIACMAVALAGLAAAPTAAPYLWMSLFAVWQGAAIALALTFIALRAPTPAQVSALSTVAQGGGYILAAAGPLLLGAIRQLTGGWTVPLALLGVLLLPQLAAGLGAATDRHIRTVVR